MEIEFQNTHKDYINFYRNHFITQVLKRSFVLVIAALIPALILAGKPFNWPFFVMAFFAILLLFLFTGYLAPYWVTVNKHNKTVAKQEGYLQKYTLSTTATGLLFQSENKTFEYSWKSIYSFYSDEKYVYITLADRKLFFIPTQSFASGSDKVNFLGILQTEVRTRAITPVYAILQTTGDKKVRPAYLLGLLCLIPLLGGVAGLLFLILGITYYKDKWFTIIGAAGIILAVAAGIVLIKYIQHEKIGRKIFAFGSQSQLDGLVKTIEFYKLQNGQYPDSLPQLLQTDKQAYIMDPIQSVQNPYYNYKRVGEKYELFSSGVDGIPNTKDDMYPQLETTDSSKLGFIKRE